MRYKTHEGDRRGAPATGDAARSAVFVRTAEGVPLGGLLVPMRASLAANLYFLASRAGFPAHFKDQVFTSETNKDPGAPNPFGGNAALPFMDSSRTARTLEARRPPGWPSPAVLERGRRKSKSLA